MKFVQAIRRVVQFIKKGDMIYFGRLNGAVPYVVAPTEFGTVYIKLDVDIPSSFTDGRALTTTLKGCKEVLGIELHELQFVLEMDNHTGFSAPFIDHPFTTFNFPDMCPQPKFDDVLQVVHAANMIKAGPLRPWVGYVRFQSWMADAGDEAQHACAHVGTGLSLIIPASGLGKWPKKKIDVESAVEGGLWLKVGEDEVRNIVETPMWWPHFWPCPVNKFKFDYPKHELLMLVKAAVKYKHQAYHLVSGNCLALNMDLDPVRLLACLSSIKSETLKLGWNETGALMITSDTGLYMEKIYPLKEVN